MLLIIKMQKRNEYVLFNELRYTIYVRLSDLAIYLSAK